MCGRFVNLTKISFIKKKFNINNSLNKNLLSYNIAPSQTSYIILKNNMGAFCCNQNKRRDDDDYQADIEDRTVFQGSKKEKNQGLQTEPQNADENLTG